MNWRHLYWICPLLFLVGGFTVIFTIDLFLDETSIYLMQKSTEMVYDATRAWEETPLSDNRIFYLGEFCYLVNNKTICPKRNVSLYGVD